MSHGSQIPQFPFPSQLGIPSISASIEHGSPMDVQDANSSALVRIENNTSGNSRKFSSTIASPERLHLNDPAKKRKSDGQDTIDQHSTSISSASAAFIDNEQDDIYSVNYFFRSCGIPVENSDPVSASSSDGNTAATTMTLQQRIEAIDAVIAAEMNDLNETLEILRVAGIKVSKLQNHIINGTLPPDLRISFSFGNPLRANAHGLEQLKESLLSIHNNYLKERLLCTFEHAKEDKKLLYEKLKRFKQEEMILTAFDIPGGGSLLNSIELRRDTLAKYRNCQQEVMLNCSNRFKERDSKYQLRIAAKVAKQEARAAKAAIPNPASSVSVGATDSSTPNPASSVGITPPTPPSSTLPLTEARIVELMEKTIASQLKQFVNDNKERTFQKHSPSKPKSNQTKPAQTNRNQQQTKQLSNQRNQQKSVQTEKNVPTTPQSKRSYLEVAMKTKPPPDKTTGRSVSIVENAASKHAKGHHSNTKDKPHFQNGSPRPPPKQGKGGGDRGKQGNRV